MNWRRIITIGLGVVSTIMLARLWVSLFVPYTWGLQFPGGDIGAASALLSAIVLSLIAGIWGSRTWLYVLGAGILTVAYILIFTNRSVWH